MGSTGTQSTDPAVDLSGNPTTIKQPPNTPFYPQEWEYIIQQKEKLGSLYATRFDTSTKSFRIQNDSTTPDDTMINGTPRPTPLAVGKPFFSPDNWLAEGIDAFYFKKIRTSQPYTDEKGYELVTPFPWGRWVDINTAIRESRLGILSETANTQGAGSVQAMNVFLFAGLASPTTNDMSSSLSTSLNQQFKSTVNGQQTTGFDSVELDSVIELQTPQPGDVGNDTSLTSLGQPDMQGGSQVTQAESSLSDIDSRLGVFLSGGTSLPNKQTLKGAQNQAPPSPTVSNVASNVTQAAASGLPVAG
jgi:hypothetical protein